MKKLFICNMGMHRSKTAAELFGGKYAGIYSNRNPVTKELLQEADVVYVMEPHQRKHIGENFPKQYLLKQIICLDIPNIYNHNEPKLVKILKQKVAPKPPKDDFDPKQYLKTHFELWYIILKLHILIDNKTTVEKLGELDKYLLSKLSITNLKSLKDIEETKKQLDKEREEQEQREEKDTMKRKRLTQLDKTFEEFMKKLK